jgi:prolipoprotein diacylglyceryltransferase
MASALAAVIAFQVFRTSPPLAAFDAALDAGRLLLPLTIGLAIGGGLLLVFVAVHGLATDATRAEPGPVDADFAGPGAAGGYWMGRFRGRLLWGASLEEESGIGELKRAWRSGQWLTDRRLFRETLVLAGLPLVVLGTFTSVALAIGSTGVRVLLVAAVLYSLVRLAWALARE